MLGHTVSSMYEDTNVGNAQFCSRSTDCPDVVSTEEEDTEMRADDSESSSDDDE